MTRGELGIDRKSSAARRGKRRSPHRPVRDLFAIGAAVPILPFVVARGSIAVTWSVIISAMGLFGIGAAITLFTGVPVCRADTLDMAGDDAQPFCAYSRPAASSVPTFR